MNKRIFGCLTQSWNILKTLHRCEGVRKVLTHGYMPSINRCHENPPTFVIILDYYKSRAFWSPHLEMSNFVKKFSKNTE